MGVLLQIVFLPGQELHACNWTSHSYREAGALGQTAHETESVAHQKPLEDPRVFKKGDPHPKISASSPTLVNSGGKCPRRSTLAPLKSLRMPQIKAGVLT